MNTNRVNEIATSFTSFTKDAYHKTEVLPELFALQTELVEKTFTEGTETAELKIWDVERRLDEMNAECGGIVTEQLEAFKKDCKYICNLIKAEISGNRGEMKAFDSLSRIHGEHNILKNIELSNNEMRSELDAVVITRNGAFIVEVKNTSRNIFIDEDGNYYRTGEFLRWDSQIGEKMQVKKRLLREVLNTKGLVDIPIYEIVVFTNNRVEVQNKCRTLKTCFLSQLPYIIDKCRDTVISFTEMNLAVQAVSEANIEKSYPFEFDVYAFKMNFANILVALEEAKEAKQNNWFKTVIDFFNQKTVKYAHTAAALAIAVLSAISSVNGR
ncbi:MAG: nuclease-related domain-containing protein [[Eubacterium] siraeum]